MLQKKSSLALFILALSISIGNVLAADLKEMPVAAQWKGVFNKTLITKYADYSDGVACYVLSPTTMATNYNDGAERFEGNNAGSISCVKLVNSKPAGDAVKLEKKK